MRINKINNIPIFGRIIICFVSIFAGVSMVFVSGIFSPNSYLEKDAIQMTSIVNDNSFNGKYVSVQVSPKDEANNDKLPVTYYEFQYWSNIFRHSNYGFVSTVNGGKTHECYYNDLDDNSNITFLYSGHNSNPEYDGFYKHEVYRNKLMFKGQNVCSNGAINFLAISQTRAKQLLESKGVVRDNGEYSAEQYSSLLGSNISISIDETNYYFSIANIYYEDDEFYKNTKATFGEFVISYIKFPECIEMEASYIFNKYDYQNYQKIKRMKEYFNDEQFNYNLSLFNLKDLTIEYNVLNNSFKNDIGNEGLSIFFIILSLLIFTASLGCFYSFEQLHKIKWLLIYNGIFMTPYLLLWLINSFYKIPLLFSYSSLRIYLILMAAMIIFDIVMSILIWRNKHEEVC